MRCAHGRIHTPRHRSGVVNECRGGKTAVWIAGLVEHMETLDAVGTFWIVGKPERKVAGRLTFNDVDGLELNLIGSLHDPLEVLSRHTGPVISVPLAEMYGMGSEPVRIVGETTGGYVTLDKCWRKSGHFPLIEGSSPAQEVYRSSSAFLGAHFGEDEPLVFTGVRTSIQNVEHWVGIPAASIELDYAEHSNEVEQLRIISTPREKMVAKTDLGELELVFGHRLGGDHILESTIRQKQALGLRFLEPQPLGDILRACKSLQDLVTVGVNAPVSIDSVRLWHADLDSAISFYARLIGATGQEGNKPPHPIDMLFTFNDIGGLQGVAKWIDVACKYQLVINILLSHKYRPSGFVEHRFFDAITAVETFARLQSQEKHINRYKVKRLSHWAGAAFKALVGDVDQWVDLVWNVRRDSVVHRGLREEKVSQLLLLAESLYFLVILCLLRECDAPARALERIQEHERFTNAASKLRRA